MNNGLYSDLTYKIIGSAMEVHKELGNGFLEKVYENSLIISLKEKNILVSSQVPLIVKFHKQEVGEYFADIVVEDKVIIELKAIAALRDEHRAQIINYLTASGFKVGLLINFGSAKLEYERFIK